MTIDEEIKYQQDKYFDKIKEILNKNINNKYEISTFYEDTKLCFDLIIKETKISIRLRKVKHLNKMDITIRYRGKKSSYSEYHKIKSGMGDIMFYGWLNQDETDIIKWVIVDLHKLRKMGIYKMNIQNPNSDGSQLCYYPLNQLYYYDCIVNSEGIDLNNLEKYEEIV